MVNISDITIKDIDNTSVRAKEIKKIYKKRGKYIDEGFGTAEGRKRTAIFFLIPLGISIKYDGNQSKILSIILFIICVIAIYHYSKKIWYREGFYEGYDTGHNDCSEEVLKIEGVEKAVIKNYHNK